MSSKKQFNQRKTLSVIWRALPVFMVTTSIAAAQNEYETPEYFAQRGLSLINTIDAYNQGYTGQGVTVGVVDSGIVVNHPEFARKIAGGYDFNLVQAITQESGTDEIPMGHGSHVSGIIAANRDGEGMHGVAFNSKLFVARYGLGGLNDDDDDDDDDDDGDGDGDGDYEQFAAITDHIFSNAWNYMAEQRLAVINNSLGVNNCSGGAASDGSKPCNVADFLPEATHYFDAKTLFPNIIDAFHNLQKAGTLMVFATGNEVQPNPDFFAGMPLLYPELQPNWLAVTAVNADLDSSTPNLAWYANACGLAKAWCLAAPGSNADGYVGINSVHSAGGY
ncbi:MAG: S8 family peptidase [Advenella sp.]